RFHDAAELLGSITELREKISRRRYSWKPKYFRQWVAASCVLLLISIIVSGFIYGKASEVHSLTLLPIINNTSDQQVEYLSEGLTRGLYDKFSYLPRLKVKLPSVVSSNINETFDPVHTGKVLKTEAVLSGEVLRVEELVKLHITMTSTI